MISGIRTDDTLVNLVIQKTGMGLEVPIKQMEVGNQTLSEVVVRKWCLEL